MQSIARKGEGNYPKIIKENKWKLQAALSTEEEIITITLIFNRSSFPPPPKCDDGNSADTTDLNFSAAFVKCHCEILQNYTSSVGCT